MGRHSGQLSMMVIDLTELIPNNYLLRRISQVISFEFICNGVQGEHNKNLIMDCQDTKIPPKRDYGRYFCILVEKGEISHGA